MPTPKIETITVTNDVDVKGEAIAALIKTYYKGFVKYGFRSIGTHPENSYPCFFVQPKKDDPKMAATGKFEDWYTYGIYWYVRENLHEDCNQSCTYLGAFMKKLFSNNALGDLQTTNSHQFMAYSPYWIDSEMGSIDFSVPYVNPDGRGNKLEQAGRMILRVQDVQLL